MRFTAYDICFICKTKTVLHLLQKFFFTLCESDKVYCSDVVMMIKLMLIVQSNGYKVMI